ncbi:hypothetical protein [Nonlabens antarcticus]|uniref:hypothetical protein n=1 Tax=Nonlabens antarcticus TaxID=392714 RepID=UPI001891356E|nr:hypothetical protein [Nonlabens antarcticus]
MCKNKIVLFFSFCFIIIGTISCADNDPLFKVDIIKKNEEKVVQFVPNMPFEIIQDSAYQYFTNEDYKKVLVASISKGKQIYKSDKFQIRVILRTYSNADGKSYEFVLRSFSKDFKIIDSYIMASNTNDIDCTGILNDDLRIETICDGTVEIAYVDEYGKFIKE